MANVIGVRFQNAGKLYFFDPGTTWPTPGDYVVVETSHGVELGEVVVPVHELEDDQLTSPLKKVIRVASAQDVQHEKDNKAAEKEAYAICQKKIAEHKLDMKLVSVEYTFDNSKILFYFTANGRVDFRALVKDLAAVFKTRIELRQIGVRDEAKMLGGLGPCGRPICCGTFLGDFQPVSIKMAKEQNLSLNPTKISGVCGRLMCCLKYEEDTYEQTRKKMPKVGRDVLTPDGWGTVWDLNIIKETVRVRVQKGDSGEVKDYTLEELNEAAAARKAEQAERAADRQAAVQSEQPEQPEDTVVSEQPEQLPESDGAEQPGSQPELPQPVQRQPRERRERPERGERPEKGERRERGERAERNQEGKPSRGERPQRGQQRSAKAADAQPKAAEAPKPAKPAAPEAPKPAAKPQANDWKLALERAMRAAQGDADDREAPAQKPVSAEDHAEPAAAPVISDEDDTI